MSLLSVVISSVASADEQAYSERYVVAVADGDTVRIGSADLDDPEACWELMDCLDVPQSGCAAILDRNAERGPAIVAVDLSARRQVVVRQSADGWVGSYDGPPRGHLTEKTLGLFGAVSDADPDFCTLEGFGDAELMTTHHPPMPIAEANDGQVNCAEITFPATAAATGNGPVAAVRASWLADDADAELRLAAVLPDGRAVELSLVRDSQGRYEAAACVRDNGCRLPLNALDGSLSDAAGRDDRHGEDPQTELGCSSRLSA